MDQIPLPFICRMVKRTLGRRRDSAGNYMPAWEKLPTEDSLDKRQATLMPTIRPTGTQPVPCLFILRGTGGQLDSGEIEAYRQAKENGVRVLFQLKAWADTWIMMRWLLHIFTSPKCAIGWHRRMCHVGSGQPRCPMSSFIQSCVRSPRDFPGVYTLVHNRRHCPG